MDHAISGEEVNQTYWIFVHLFDCKMRIYEQELPALLPAELLKFTPPEALRLRSTPAMIKTGNSAALTTL